MAAAPERCILLVADEWHPTRDGLYGINRHLALSLSHFSGVRVHCALLSSLSKVKSEAIKDAKAHNVSLIGTEYNSDGSLWEAFNEFPSRVFPDLSETVPGVTHIIGHSPVSAEGAVRLRDEVYSASKVLLFYHVLPKDVAWINARDLSYDAPTDNELVGLAERADVVYSVTEKLHWHFTAKFRNRASQNIDHRLFLPQSPTEIFSVAQSNQQTGTEQPIVLVLSSGMPAPWNGLDIAAYTVNKVGLAMMDRPTSTPMPRLIIGNVHADHKSAVTEYVEPYITVAGLDVEYHSYASTADIQEDLRTCTVALIPARAEPFGHMGLSVLSSGVPSLIAENCAIASLIKHLTLEPEKILVPVTPSCNAARQDASMWRDRILRILSNLQATQEQAAQLRTALRRDESAKITHDNVICYCLGGIRLHHHVSHLAFKLEDQTDLELPVLRAFNGFISEMLRQCWRLKHHPLTGEDDLTDLLPRVETPHQELIKLVVDRIEEYDRKIVGRDACTGTFLVYCPTLFALCDLWAVCDIINTGLVRGLLAGTRGSHVLGHFGLSDASLVTTISGPEFLTYKKQLISTTRPKTAAL